MGPWVREVAHTELVASGSVEAVSGPEQRPQAWKPGDQAVPKSAGRCFIGAEGVIRVAAHGERQLYHRGHRGTRKSSVLWSGTVLRGLRIFPAQTRNGPIARTSIRVRWKQSYGLIRSADDRLIFVEAGVQNHGNSGFAVKSGNQIVVQRIFFAGHSLQAARVVDVVHCAQVVRASPVEFYRRAA